MMFAMGYSSDKTTTGPWRFRRKPTEETVTLLKKVKHIDDEKCNGKKQVVL